MSRSGVSSAAWRKRKKEEAQAHAQTQAPVMCCTCSTRCARVAQAQAQAVAFVLHLFHSLRSCCAVVAFHKLATAQIPSQVKLLTNKKQLPEKQKTICLFAKLAKTQSSGVLCLFVCLFVNMRFFVCWVCFVCLRCVSANSSRWRNTSRHTQQNAKQRKQQPNKETNETTTNKQN